MSERIFISSVQKELAEGRRAIRDFVRGDALFRRFFDVFLFEDLPASNRRADEVYLDEVERCPIYVGLFGQEYCYEDPPRKSPRKSPRRLKRCCVRPPMRPDRGRNSRRHRECFVPMISHP